jgi:hypothetical protein
VEELDEYGELLQIDKILNTDIYKGEFEDGVFCGHGEMLWGNGNYYLGGFKWGMYYGKGTVEYKNLEA